MPRKPSCTCGSCTKCKHAAHAREVYAGMTPEERRAWTARRDPDSVREHHRRKMARKRAEGTPEQKLKLRARDQVRLALIRGDLVREECEVDGCIEIGHAHHDDYTKPLEVRWLCRAHHDEHHRET